jgi:serine protease Do
MNNQTVQMRRSLLMVTLAGALVMGGLLAWGITSSDRPVFGAPAVTLKVAPSNNLVESGKPLNEGFADVVAPLLPAVVNVSTSKVVARPTRGQSPFGDDPFFNQFFGNPFGGDDQGQGGQGSRREHSLGSGIIVSPDGYILTNNHVVDGASDIEVTLKDGRSLKAKVIGTDSRTDVAVLKIPATGLATVTLGDSTKMRAGDIVLAIGDPLGVGESVTMGIVSATGRRSLGISGNGGYEDFIQTDAAINPGNSGGALVNARGELIGINTAIISNGGGGNEGIGFAIPISMARSVMEQLLKNGKVTRGYLGVSIQPVSADVAKAFGLPTNEGALIGDVTADSPGGKAGLQRGDVIVGLNGTPVMDYSDLRLRVSQMAPGSNVKLDVYRGGQKREMNVTLGELPENPNQASEKPEVQPGEDALMGVQVSNLTADIARQLNLNASTRGVVVTNVDQDSAAGEHLTKGDVIQEVNRMPVNNVEQFRSAVRGAGSNPILVLVNHGGTTRYEVISPR